MLAVIDVPSLFHCPDTQTFQFKYHFSSVILKERNEGMQILLEISLPNSRANADFIFVIGTFRKAGKS
jgi:hypothetical protein